MWTIRQTGVDRTSSALHKALGIGRLAKYAAGLSSKGGRRADFLPMDPGARRHKLETALMASAAILGFWGFQEVAPSQGRWSISGVWDSAYKTLQLLTTQFPGDIAKQLELPIPLQIARFAMPIFAVWFSFAALLRRYNRPLVAFVARLSRNHVVLIGDSPITAALARAYRLTGRRVVAISPPPVNSEVAVMEAAGARTIFGDPKTPSTLIKAAVQHAAIVIVAEDLGSESITLATRIAGLARKTRARTSDPLVLLMRITHRELRPLLSSQIATALIDSRVSLRLYVRERTIARSLLSRYPADWGSVPGLHDMHAVIFGLGDMGGEILLQLAKIAVPAPGRRCFITVIDREANGLRDQLLAAYPGLAKCADLHFVEAEIRPSATEAGNIEAWIESRIPATAIYVCCGDDHANLSLAIGLRRLYALKDTATPPLFVHQRSSYELVDGLAELHGNSFDALRIIPFGGLAEEADPYYVVDEEVDVLSRLLHERYLLERQQSGANNPTPAAVPWPDLADSYRSANRSQADHIVVKLRNLGWHAVITSGSTPHGDLPPVSGALLEQMANQEHERWCRDRWLAGWTYDAKRNDAELQHPNLLPYEDLPDDIRQYDRIAITQLPNLMEGLGVSIRQGQRLGLWFESCDSAPSAELIEKVLDRLQADRSRDTRARYLQLILPLRNPAETKLAASLSNYVDCGVEVALIRPFSKSSVSIGPKVDRDDARLIIAAADRASTLLPPYSPEVASEVTHLSAFCGVCDKVLLICEDAETCESIIHQMDAQLHDKVEFVAIRY